METPSPFIHVRVLQLMNELIKDQKIQRDYVIKKAGIRLNRGRNIWKAKQYFFDNPTSMKPPKEIGATLAKEKDLTALLRAFPDMKKYALADNKVLKPMYYPVRIEGQQIVGVSTLPPVQSWQLLHFLHRRCGVAFSYLKQEVLLGERAINWNDVYLYAYEDQEDTTPPTNEHYQALLQHYFFLADYFVAPINIRERLQQLEQQQQLLEEKINKSKK